MSFILRVDSIGGASGDMMLGALHDLGVPLEEITEALASLPIDPFFLTTETVNERGITAQRVTVHIGEQVETPPHSHDHSHHQDAHDHEHDHGHGHHRHLPDIEKIIDSGDLPDRVRDMARSVFHRLADAEASVHGISRDKVHFHEVGAMDSIVDIIGSCWALHHLGVTQIQCASLPVGQGSFTCAHGTYPLPAPATLALLQGFPMESTEEPFELVTPTGAALVTTFLDSSTPTTGRVERIGYGAGHRTLQNRPNVLRASLLSIDEGSEEPVERIVMLECNVDDTSGEWLGAMAHRLMNAGALDVHSVPCFMKKNRPGYELRVLCLPADQTCMEEIMFEETMTLGIRYSTVSRTVLPRRMVQVQTPWGEVGVKVATLPSGGEKVKPEFDDCERVAQESGRSVREVYTAAIQAVENGEGNHE